MRKKLNKRGLRFAMFLMGVCISAKLKAGTPKQLAPDTSGMPNLSTIVAARLLEFKGIVKNNTRAELNWVIFENDQLKTIYIQRSNDGISFTTIDTIHSNSSVHNKAYQYTDPLKNVSGNRVYYRLILIDNDNKTKKSDILMLSVKNAVQDMHLSPNPAVNYTQLYFSMPEKGTGQLELINPSGRVLMKKTINYTEGNVAIGLGDLHNYPIGVYRVVFQSPGRIYSQNLVISN